MENELKTYIEEQEIMFAKQRKALEMLDEAVDKVMAICGISEQNREVAMRALTAALARKGVKKPSATGPG